ncbi:D-glycerate 3-kinase, chloroplastic [Linum perenne]
MAMAGLNSASPLCCSFSAKLHTHDCDYTVSIEISSSRNKPFPFPCSYHCSSSNSSLSRSSKQSRIQTHFSKSGHGCSSWRIGSSLDSAFPSAPAEVAAVENLYEFICSGPLIAKIGLSSETIAESIDKWLLYGSLLCRLFQLNDMYLTEPQKARFYHYYIPVFIWCENQISKHSSQFKDGEDIPPLVIGFSAPQGCGKTTLVSALAHLFDAEIAMREAGKPGMTDEEVKDFVSRYLPAYKAYLPTLYAEGPKGSVPENLLVIEIDEARNPILEN